MAERKKREPWLHHCDECGAEVMTANYGRVLCPECREKSKLQAHAKYNHSEKGKKARREGSRRYRERHYEEVLEKQKAYKAVHREQMNGYSKKYYCAHADHLRLCARLRGRARRGDAAAKMEYDKLLGRVQTCPRMRVTMRDLPCGQRPECWAGKPCEKCAGMHKPRNYHWGY